MVTWISSCSTPQPLPQFLPHLGVERAERLVEQQHARLSRQRPGQGHALPLAAGKLRRPAFLEALQPHQPQQFADALADLRLLPAAHPQAEGDVLEDAHVPEQGVVLEHEADVALAGRAVRHVLVLVEDRRRRRPSPARR